MRSPRERCEQDLFVENAYVLSSSKDSMKMWRESSDQQGYGVQKFKNKGEVIVLEDVNWRVGKAHHDGHVVEGYGEEIVDENG